MPALAPKPKSASRNAHEAQKRRQVLRAHVGERVVAGVGLQHAEAQQDRDRADVRDQQVEVAGALDLGDAVVGGDEEERGERHHLPAHHEGVGVVGEQHHRHRREEDVVLQAHEPRRRAFALRGNSRPRRSRCRRSRAPGARGRTPRARPGAGGTAGPGRPMARIAVSGVAGSAASASAGERDAQRRRGGEEDARHHAEVAQRGDPGEADRRTTPPLRSGCRRSRAAA